MEYSYDRTAGTRIAQGGIAALDYINLTQKAKDALIKLDSKFEGTDNYMGVSFFWYEDYKWWLRDAKAKVRRQVHAAFVKAGLKPDGHSPEHRKVIEKFFPDAKNEWAKLDAAD
jgi:hypothetical protein